MPVCITVHTGMAATVRQLLPQIQKPWEKLTGNKKQTVITVMTDNLCTEQPHTV